MEKYKIQKSIGSGSFANVVKAINIQTNEIVAIKKMKKKFSSWEECLSLREIKSLTKLSHIHITKLKEVIRLNDELYCVFEFMEQNIYQFYLSRKESQFSLTTKEIKSIIYQTTLALAYMHKHGYFHRDLKPENILLNRGVVKIADLGLAREIRARPPFTEYVATRWYRAPEILLRSTNYNSPVDIFALGCIMAELYLLKPLFAGNSEMDQLYRICAILGTPSKENWSEGYRLSAQSGIGFPSCAGVGLGSIIEASPEAINLMSMMLTWDPSKRITAVQLLQHPFLEDSKEYFSEESTKDQVEFTEEKREKRIEKLEKLSYDPDPTTSSRFYLKKAAPTRPYDEEIPLSKSPESDEDPDEIVLENKPKKYLGKLNVPQISKKSGGRNSSLENKQIIKDKSAEKEEISNIFPKLRSGFEECKLGYLKLGERGNLRLPNVNKQRIMHAGNVLNGKQHSPPKEEFGYLGRIKY